MWYEVKRYRETNFVRTRRETALFSLVETHPSPTPFCVTWFHLAPIPTNLHIESLFFTN